MHTTKTRSDSGTAKGAGPAADVVSMADNLNTAYAKEANYASAISAFNAQGKADRLALRAASQPVARTGFVARLFNR